MLDIHGGYVAAITARAIELAIDDPARTLRSFTVQFIRPAHAGDVTIAIDITRTGRSVSFLRAVVAQDERPVLTAAAVLGTSRDGLAFAELPTPPGALSGPPSDAERFTGSEPGFHFEQLDFRLEPGLSIFGNHDRAHVSGWLAPLDPTETITLPWLICATDFMPPSMVFRTDRPVQAATVDMAVQLLCNNPSDLLKPGEHLYADVNCSISADGFSVEDGTFWAPSRTPSRHLPPSQTCRNLSVPSRANPAVWGTAPPCHPTPVRRRVWRRETSVVSVFVIVHGGFGGGWEWTPVAQQLRERGHVVFTPTLTGMGERRHLGPRVGLDTHIDDVVAVLEFEDLHDVVLCGASYGGMAVTGAADRAPERVALVVYVDALVPLDGQSGIDLLPEGFGALVRAGADEDGHGWVAVPDAVLPPQGLIVEEIRARYVARLRDQPVATFTEPIHLTSASGDVRRAFIRCTGDELDVGGDPIEPMAARARAEGWLYRELSASHDPHLFDPTATAVLLDELAAVAESDRRNR